MGLRCLTAWGGLGAYPRITIRTKIKIMKRLFRKGERVKSKTSGKVMEVLRYIKKNILQVKLFDIEKKEIKFETIREKEISKAA